MCCLEAVLGSVKPTRCASVDRALANESSHSASTPFAAPVEFDRSLSPLSNDPAPYDPDPSNADTGDTSLPRASALTLDAKAAFAAIFAVVSIPARLPGVGHGRPTRAGTRRAVANAFAPLARSRPRSTRRETRGYDAGKTTDRSPPRRDARARRRARDGTTRARASRRGESPARTRARFSRARRPGASAGATSGREGKSRDCFARDRREPSLRARARGREWRARVGADTRDDVNARDAKLISLKCTRICNGCPI